MNPHSPTPLPSRARAALAAAGALLPLPTAAGAAGAPGAEIVEAASRTVALVAGVLVVVILLPVAFLVYRRLFGVVRGAPDAPTVDDPLAAAEAEERRGSFAAAAERFDAAGDKLRAAGCWERARDLPRAAEAWEAAGELEKAAALHVRSGGSLRAAGIYMRTKNYVEAAKIFRNKGDHLRAAQALELFGNAVAAAREYSAAGNHARAARLLEEEGMYAGAAAAYRPLLGDGGVAAGNAAQHTTYAALLALAGDRERAAAVYRDVLAALPGNLRAASGLHSLATRAPAPDGAGPPKPRAGPVRIAPGDLDLDIDYLEPAEAPADASAGGAAQEPPPGAALPPPPSPEEVARLLEADEGALGGDPHAQIFTLRSMIHAGRMEPRYSMRLWVQAMRALAERHGANVVHGCLTPESLAVDMENNVRIEAPAGLREPYASPEVLAGLPPDRQADVYSMGVILFELVTGSTDLLGRKRAGEIVADVPSWLDELIERCTEKNLTKRYRTTEEVSAALLKLKSAAAE